MHTDYPKLRSIEEWISPNIGLISELFQSISPQCSKLGCISLRSHFKPKLKPSLSMKILYINNFTTKILSDLSIGVHLKAVLDTKKFGSKVNNRQYFHIKNSHCM